MVDRSTRYSRTLIALSIVFLFCISPQIFSAVSSTFTYAFSTTGSTKFTLDDLRNITIRSPNSQDDGHFGSAESISGSTLVVSAPFESVSGFSQAGHVYVYNATSGKLLHTLSSPNAQNNGNFGNSVSVSGSILVIGALENVKHQYGPGIVYVYNATTGALMRSLTNPNANDSGYFDEVSASGNLIVVGAECENVNGTDCAGQAYVFSALSGELVSTLRTPRPQYYGDFGHVVATSGDRVVVTAPGENGTGHAYVFEAGSGKLIQVLRSPNQAQGFFGFSAAMNGNLIAIGAPWQNFKGYYEAGKVYVFNATTGKLIESLSSPHPQELGWYGVSLAVQGKSLAVGSGERAHGWFYAGRVYVYREEKGTRNTAYYYYKLTLALTSPSSQYKGWFAQVVLSNSLIVVGAANEFNGSGRAYIFSES